MKTTLAILALMIALCLKAENFQSSHEIIVEKGTAPTIDGNIAESEWGDANQVKIVNSMGHTVTVRYKHDDKNIYFAFINLMVTKEKQRAAEILIDETNSKSPSWKTGIYWFHASYSDCFENGNYFIWEDCSKTKSDWDANNLPLEIDNDNIEFRIPFAKISSTQLDSKEFGIAFCVGDDKNNVDYWPPTAIIDSPSTWGVCIIK